MSTYEQGLEEGKQDTAKSFAIWMDVPVEWLQHVVERNFTCACRPYDEEDIHCEEWQAILGLEKASQRYGEAKAILEKASYVARGR